MSTLCTVSANVLTQSDLTKERDANIKIKPDRYLARGATSPRSVCCCFRFSNKAALVVTRVLMVILISQPLAIRLKPASAGHGTWLLILVCAQNRLGTLSGCLWLAFLCRNEPFPTD